jgi:hypothetical protein
MKRVIIYHKQTKEVLGQWLWEELSPELQAEALKATTSTRGWEKKLNCDTLIVEVEDVPEPTPVSGPVPEQTWTAPLSRQMCFFDYPAYFGLLMPRVHVMPWLGIIREAGLTGPEIELAGPDVVDEYINRHPTPNYDFESWYDHAEDEMAFIMPIVRSLGLVVNLKFTQSNWSQVQKRTPKWWSSRAKRFAVRIGPENIICLAVNETDPRVNESYRYAIEEGLLAGGFQKWQLVSWNTKRDLGFVENHPRTMDHIQGSDHRRLQIPDNGDMIYTLFGKNWRQGGTPNSANISKYIQRCKAAGTSTGIYSFSRDPSIPALTATRSAWGT